MVGYLSKGTASVPMACVCHRSPEKQQKKQEQASVIFLSDRGVRLSLPFQTFKGVTLVECFSPKADTCLLMSY